MDIDKSSGNGHLCKTAHPLIVCGPQRLDVKPRVIAGRLRLREKSNVCTTLSHQLVKALFDQRFDELRISMVSRNN